MKQVTNQNEVYILSLWRMIAVLLTLILGGAACECKQKKHSPIVASGASAQHKISFLELTVLQEENDYKNPRIRYFINNHSQEEATDVVLSYKNTSLDMGSQKATLNGKLRDVIPSDPIPAEATKEYVFALDFHGAEKCSFKMEVFSNGEPIVAAAREDECIVNTGADGADLMQEQGVLCGDIEEAQEAQEAQEAIATQEVKSSMSQTGRVSFEQNSSIKPIFHDSWLRTPLIRAVLSGDIGQVEKKIQDLHPSINEVDKLGFSPLHWAIYWRNESMVDLLLAQQEINIKLQNSFGMTPLHYAVRKRDALLVSRLLDRLDTAVNTPDRWGNTPLHEAILRSEKEIVQLLLGHPAIDPNVQNGLKNTPMHTAVMQGKSIFVSMLVKHPGIDLNLQGEGHQTPTQMALFRGYKTIVEELQYGMIAQEIRNM